MTPEEFIKQAALLTGTEIKGEKEIDRANLASILSRDSRVIDCSQFNELLLLVHKDRVQGPLFTHFFGANCKIGDIPDGVSRFRKVAMLLYGNFIFGYRTLSKIGENKRFYEELGEAAKDPKEERKKFKNRRPKLLDFKKIERQLTPFVGYLSAGQVAVDRERCEFLTKALEKSHPTRWSDLESKLKLLAGDQEYPVLVEIVNNYRARFAGANPVNFAVFLVKSLKDLTALDKQVQEVRKRASDIQDTYLSWDHMDVYFATSMRKAWEYRDLYDFIDKLMKRSELKDLGVRYFDPTQAYTKDRINKGLIEALMLKRARCTVYSVQDTDTLGKDSELASTLAQGKPVIAYIPQIDVDARTKELRVEDPATILERLRFVLYADEQFAQKLGPADYKIVDTVQDELDSFAFRRIWVSLPDQEENDRIRKKLGQRLDKFCRIIAISEKRIYDKRAKTLIDSHPLAVQVNLETGVANGVLVVRSVDDCTRLLCRTLLYDMQFKLEDSPNMWYLREEISGCVFRVVTKDIKLSNCFWNFYLR
jgi:hypothetical protein